MDVNQVKLKRIKGEFKKCILWKECYRVYGHYSGTWYLYQ